MKMRWPVWLAHPSMFLKAIVLWKSFEFIAQSNFSVSMLYNPEDIILLAIFSWVASAVIVGVCHWYFRKLERLVYLKMGWAADAPKVSQSVNEGFIGLAVLPLGGLVDWLVGTRLLTPFISIFSDYWALVIPPALSIAYVYHSFHLFGVELQKELEKQKLKQELKACTLSDRELRRLQRSKVKITRRRYRRGKPRPADPIAMELNQIRKDLGLH